MKRETPTSQHIYSLGAAASCLLRARRITISMPETLIYIVLRKSWTKSHPFVVGLALSETTRLYFYTRTSLRDSSLASRSQLDPYHQAVFVYLKVMSLGGPNPESVKIVHSVIPHQKSSLH